MKKEREEREKIERELAENKRKEEEEKKRIEAERKKAANAPDKQKLLAVVKNIDSIELPDVSSDDAKRVVDETRSLLSKVSKYVTDKANSL